MEDVCAVYLGGTPAGKLRIVKEGLYCRLICNCHVPEDMVYRLFVQTEDGRESLGVVVPEGDGFALNRKVPAKKLQRAVRFLLSARTAEDTGKFVPVYPQEPFSYLSDLENAFLQSRDGQQGVSWKETVIHK